MHELSIAENIIEIVTGQLKADGVHRMVERVLVKAGRLNAIIPESLRFNFDVLKESSELLRHAVLDIETIPVKVRCDFCDRTWNQEEPVFICPDCGRALSVLSGQELLVESITVRD